MGSEFGINEAEYLIIRLQECGALFLYIYSKSVQLFHPSYML